MKTSVNKISYPCPKQIFRFERNNCFIKDIITLEEEKIENANPLLLQYIKDGQLIKKLPNLFETKKCHQKQIASLPERFKKINHNRSKISCFFKSKTKESNQGIRKMNMFRPTRIIV